jgi:hypothetical protein
MSFHQPDVRLGHGKGSTVLSGRQGAKFPGPSRVIRDRNVPAAIDANVPLIAEANSRHL